MLNRKVLGLFILTFFFAFVFVFVFVNSSGHERVHYDVAVYAGCSASVTNNFLSDSFTMVDCNNVSLSSEMQLSMYDWDVRLEFFDYVFDKVVLFLCFCLVSFLVLKFFWVGGFDV